MVSIAASLDGLEETHDRHRRLPGSFRRVTRLIDDCNALGLPVGAEACPLGREQYGVPPPKD